MTAYVCSCGWSRCYINIYFKQKHHKISRYYDDKPLDYERAVSMLGEIRTAIEKHTFKIGDYVGRKERRFDIMSGKWLDFKDRQVQRGEVHPSSVYSIRRIVFNHLKYFDNYNVREINTELLYDFLDSLPDALKRKTKKNILVCMRAFMAWCWQRGTITAIPAFPEIEGTDDSKEKVALDYEYQQVLLKKVPAHHRGIIEFGMETGLRVGELVTLQVRDIDLQKGEAIIRRTVSGNVVIETTKGGSKKPIPLSERAIEIVVPHMQGKIAQAWLFVNPVTNLRYSVNRLNRVWKKATKLDVTYYEASRHSFITQCLDSGVNLIHAKELARHSDTRMTEKYYHGEMKRLRDATNRRGKVVPYSLPSRQESVDGHE